MSTSSMNIPTDLSADKFTLGARAGSWVGKLSGIGLITLVAMAGVGLSSGDLASASRFWHAYLAAYMFVCSIALGAMIFVLLQNVTSAGWSVTVRRIAELITMTFPLLGLLALPLVYNVWFGHGELFLWSDTHSKLLEGNPGLVHLIEAKSGYLNKTFFTIRMGVYFLSWILVSRWAFNTSLKQDQTGDPLLTNKLKKFSAPAIPLMALTLTFFSLDMLMSLDPAWFSTIFGVYYFAGGFGAFMALLGILSKKLGEEGILKGFVRDEHYHDIGKLTFAFVMFWGYIAFSQYILIWYANIPEETAWYLERSHMPWARVEVLFVLKFIVPFLGLMSRHMKRVPGRMVIFGSWMLLMQLYDMFFLVLPSHATNLTALGATEAAHDFGVFPIGIPELFCTLGMVLIFAGGIARAFSKHSILAVRDPRMTETMTFHNP
jgi:hypothetical protein